VALQWFVPPAGGEVLEFWWYNYQKQGVSKKAKIQTWYVDPRVQNYPGTPITKFLGTYKDSMDGDGGVQPYKPDSGNQWFYSNGFADSIKYSFDPILKEAGWVKGGIQVTLDSNVWQGITLTDFGDIFPVIPYTPFGFTITNDTKKSEIVDSTDVRMELLSAQSIASPYHSLKFYETGRTAPENAGWHLRGDYEWGMYVVVEYCSDRPPRFIVDRLPTTLSADPRVVNATIDNIYFCYFPYVDSIDVVYLYFKSNSAAKFDSVIMSSAGNSVYTGTLPSFSPGDTIQYFVKAKSHNGLKMMSVTMKYRIFKKMNTKLFVNNAVYSPPQFYSFYAGLDASKEYDFWDAKYDGTENLPLLYSWYSDILIADPIFPSKDIWNALHERLDNATVQNPVALFVTSQDYAGRYPSWDTTYTPGTLAYDYFGLWHILQYDLPPTQSELRIIPLADTVTNYLIRYGTENTATLWHDPYFEHGEWGFPDALRPRPEAKPLFLDGDSNIVGIKYITPTTRTVFLAIDAASLQFRSDTSLLATNDPKYTKIGDVGYLASSFFNTYKVTSIQTSDNQVPEDFRIEQNYPNPFNPSTTIEFSIPQKSDVKVTIYNMLGQKVAVLVNEKKDPGRYRVLWNATRMASGLYFYELRAGSFTSVKKMLLLK
ncbi:MAG: T9SS type A sorting domain-containing protein, partial [Bacteriovoracaceae bacterium]